MDYRALSTADLADELVLESEHYRATFRVNPDSLVLRSIRQRIHNILREMAVR